MVFLGVVTVITVLPVFPPSTRLPLASMLAKSGSDEVKLAPSAKLYPTVALLGTVFKPKLSTAQSLEA